MTQRSKTDRGAILRAAVEILAQNGLQGVSIRSVAGGLGVAPNALYHYFTNREHLEAAIASEVAAMLHARLIKACADKQPDEAIRSMVQAYLAFARDHRFLYEAILVARARHAFRKRNVGHSILHGY